MYKLYCRIYQAIFRMVSASLPWRKPELIEGKNSLVQLPLRIRSEGVDAALIVTDSVIASLGLMNPLLDGLKLQGIRFAVYNKTVPNPTLDNIEEALALYKQSGCNGIIAFGGGSPMDCAKAVGARIVRPNKKIPQMRGALKVRKKLPPLFAVPTTAGTGSEATLAAVITNNQTHEKYSIMDMALIPHVAVLDPTLTVCLPPHITATTGMDALVHAVEAYIGKSNTKETKDCAVKAVQLIFDNLYEAYKNGSDLRIRANMQKAAYYAGVAFTRAYVGYVHAVGHRLSAYYGTPHGLANAVIMPYVLDQYGEAVYQPLAQLADAVQIGDHNGRNEQKAKRFIEAVRQLNEGMNIPSKIEGICMEDIPEMVRRALKEANPLYPVPKIWGTNEITHIYNQIKQ